MQTTFSDSQIERVKPTGKRQVLSVGEAVYVIVEPIKKVNNKFKGKSLIGKCRFPSSRKGKQIDVRLGLYGKGEGHKTIFEAKQYFKSIKKLSKWRDMDPRQIQKLYSKNEISNELNYIKNKNFKFWGHNCFSIETKNAILLIDPWFSKKGAFFGSWYQYPKNHSFRKDVLKLLAGKKAGYIFITHEHEDHLDTEFLKLIPKEIKIIIPNYEDKEFKKLISQYPNQILEFKDSKEYLLKSEIKITLKIVDVGVNHDAAILIETNELAFFNQNDCKVFDRLTELKTKIDFYSVQFSGANAHPSTFKFPETKKIELSKYKVNSKLENVLKALKIIRPTYFLPAAGPAIFPFLESNLSLGKNNIFIHQDHLKKFLFLNGFKNIIFLRPGNIFDSKQINPIPNPTLKDLELYKKDLEDIWQKLPDLLDRKKLETLIKLRFSKIKNIKLSNCPIIIFNYSGVFNDNLYNNKNKIFIDLNNKTLLKNFDYSSNFIEIISSKRYFNLLCEEKWQSVSLSLRAEIVQKPDIFNNDVNLFLFSDLSNIKSNFVSTKKIKKDRIKVISQNQKCFQINKYCPHQHANLTKAEINDKCQLICPAHGWKFELEENGIDKQSNLSINALEIE